MTPAIALDPAVFAAGGLMSFSGGTDPAKAGLVGALLSGAIEELTHSKSSHVALVLPASYWPDGKPWIVESTIWGKVSGPQFNELGPRLQIDYAARGGHAALLRFQPEFAPEWSGVWTAAQQLMAQVKAGTLHYSVKRLFADATERNLAFAALPVAGILGLLAQQDHGLVCSECAGLLMQAGGVDAKAKAAGIAWLPKVEPVAGQPIGCAPQDLLDMPIWQAAVPVL